MYIKIFASI